MMEQGESVSPATLDWPKPGVARIRLVRGERHNTLTGEAIATLHRLVDECMETRARVLVITGSGQSFCGGAHVKYFTDPDAPLHRNPRAIRDDYVLPITRLLRRLQEAPFVTIAAINGFALGGGCELAISCDLRIMSSTARIGLPEVRLGAVAGASGVQDLSRLVGRARALEIALLGERISAAEALAAGLVSAVHEPEDLDEAAIRLAARFLDSSPAAIAETKRAIYQCESLPPQAADAAALDAVFKAAAGGEWWEGMAAFVERRPPDFATERK